MDVLVIVIIAQTVLMENKFKLLIILITLVYVKVINILIKIKIVKVNLFDNYKNRLFIFM